MPLAVQAAAGLGLANRTTLLAAALVTATLSFAEPTAADPPHPTSPASEEAGPEEPEADKPRKKKDDPGGLMEDEFSALELFRNIHRLRPRFRLGQDATIHQDFSGADVDSYHTSLRAQVVAPLSRRLAIRLVGNGEITTFDFHGNRQFLDTGNSGDPFDELLATSLRLEGRYQLPYNFTAVAGGTYRSGWERGASYDSGMQGGGFAGLGYIFRERFSIVAAASLRSKLGRSSSLVVSPLLKVGFRITDKLEIESDGVGGKIAYRPIRELTLFVRGTRDSDRYRLKNGDIVRDRKAPVLFGWSWRISKHWRFRGHLGAVVYQEWRVSKTGGGVVDRETSKSPAFTGRLQIEYRF
jgi:hypothetical protein